jgi:hypothetical protein
LDQEKKKNENIGIELINAVNENKALHDEVNDIYKRSGSTSEENHEMKEALIYSKVDPFYIKKARIAQ